MLTRTVTNGRAVMKGEGEEEDDVWEPPNSFDAKPMSRKMASICDWAGLNVFAFLDSVGAPAFPTRSHNACQNSTTACCEGWS